MPLISFVLAALAASQRELFSPVLAPAQRLPPALAPQLGETGGPDLSPSQAWAQIDPTDTGAARGASWIWGALVLAAGAAYFRPTTAGPGSTVADQLAAELAHHEHNAALTRLSMLATSGENPDFLQKVKDWFQSLTGSEEENPPATPEEAPEVPEAPEEATDATEETPISMLALSGKPRANVKMDLGTDAKDFFEKVTSFFEKLNPKAEKKEEAPEAPEDTEVTEDTDTEPTEAEPDK